MEKKTGPNPTDRAKLGVKRSVLSDGNGIPLGIEIDGANRHDMKLFLRTLLSIPIPRPSPTPDEPQNIVLDKGYDYDIIYQQAVDFGLIPHIHALGEPGKALKAGEKARRWVVERLHSWMNSFRHLLIRWAKKPENYLAMIHLAFACILFKQSRAAV